MRSLRSSSLRPDLAHLATNYLGQVSARAPSAVGIVDGFMQRNPRVHALRTRMRAGLDGERARR